MDKLLEFWKLLGNLKTIPRTGWLVRGVAMPETVAAHNWRVSLIAYHLSNFYPDADKEKIILMALYHELGETKLGDVPTPMGSYFSKDEVELQICEDIFKEYELFSKDKEIIREYFEKETLEKRIVVAADKIDLFMQALFYWEAGNPKIEDFFRKLDIYKEKFDDLSEISQIFQKIKERYEQEKRD
jgi:putative hydrolase of HD superfamily